MITELDKKIIYIIKNHKNDKISLNRLEKLLYLSDWFFTLLYEKELFSNEWEFSHNGPTINLLNFLNTNNFLIENNAKNEIINKFEISIKDYCNQSIQLLNEEKKIIDYVISKTKDLLFDDFINYIYATYPIQAPERNKIMNLNKLSKEYKENLNK